MSDYIKIIDQGFRLTEDCPKDVFILRPYTLFDSFFKENPKRYRIDITEDEEEQFFQYIERQGYAMRCSIPADTPILGSFLSQFVIPTEAEMKFFYIAFLHTSRKRDEQPHDIHIKLLSIESIETIALSYITKDFAAKDMSQRDTLQYLFDTKLPNRTSVELKALSEECKRFLMIHAARVLADEFGCSLVSDEGHEDEPPFSYTVYLSEKTGFELVVVGSLHHGPHILSAIAQMYLEREGTFTDVEEGELENIHVETPNGTVPMRYRLVALWDDLENPTVKQIQLYSRQYVDKTPDIIQVMIADKNNHLPGEKDYDERFVQQLGGVQYH